MTGSERQPLLSSSDSNGDDESLDPITKGKSDDDLPPTDTGKDAWLCLAACFTTEAILWGIPFSFGVFEEYCNGSGIATIGTSATGLMYFGAPIVSYVLHRWPQTRRFSSAIGLVVTTVALAAASFAVTVWQLVLTQGVLYGVGGSLLYNPMIFYLDGWFDRRKGLAFGILWAGTGISGTVMPVVVDWVLRHYGLTTTLRAWAVGMFALAAPLVYFTKPRVPPSQQIRTSEHNTSDFAFLATSTFWILEVCNIIESLGYFMPLIYLPSYAISVGQTHTIATLSISLINFAAVIGNIMTGALIDHLHITTVILILTTASAITVLAGWGLAVSQSTILTFAALYGLFAGGFKSTWAGSAMEVKRLGYEVEMGVIMGLFPAGRGLGAMVSGPVSERLLGLQFGGEEGVGYGFGTGFGVLIAFTGLTALVSGFPWLLRACGLGAWRGNTDSV